MSSAGSRKRITATSAETGSHGVCERQQLSNDRKALRTCQTGLKYVDGYLGASESLRDANTSLSFMLCDTHARQPTYIMISNRYIASSEYFFRY
jgi:hypothetical protein